MGGINCQVPVTAWEARLLQIPCAAARREEEEGETSTTLAAGFVVSSIKPSEPYMNNAIFIE